MEMDHGAPVETVLMFPSGGTCVSAGGNYVRVWDLLNGGRLLLAFSNHQKTITSLCFDGCGHRLFTAGLDKLVSCVVVHDTLLLGCSQLSFFYKLRMVWRLSTRGRGYDVSGRFKN